MARALRLRIEYKDINELDTQINIYSEGFLGAYEEAPAGEKPLTISWGDESTKKLPERYGSSATISCDSETEDQFSDLYSADSRANLVEVIKAGSMLWTGFVDSGDWCEPMTHPPYPISIKAYDSIGLLKNEYFTDENDDPYEGEKTLLEILTIILTKTGLELNINTAVNYRESTQSSVQDALIQTKKDVVVYEGLSCYEIFGQLFPACRIQQRNGEWYVISNDNFTKTTISTYKYDHSGTSLGAGSFSPQTSQGWWFEDEANKKTLPALKHWIISQDYDPKDSIIENGDFASYNPTTNIFSGWTNNNITPEQGEFADGSGYYAIIRDKQYFSDLRDQNEFISFASAIKTSTNSVRLKFRWVLFGDKTTDSAYVTYLLKLVGDSGTTYYMRREVGQTEEETKYVWTTSEFVEPVRWAYEKKYANIDPINCVLEEDIEDSFKQFEEVCSGGLPEDGTLIFQFYAPNTADSDNFGVAITDYEIDIVQDIDSELPESNSIKLTNNIKNNYVPDELEFINGDIPDISNSSAIYRGGFLLANGDPTNGWKVDGLTGSYNFIELIGRLLASSMRNPRQAYDIKLADFIPGTDMIIIDPNNSNKKFIEAGITYNDRMQTAEGRYIEVVDDDLSGDGNFSVDTVTDEDESSSSSSTSGGSLEDKKVAVRNIDKELSKAGYLTSSYFHATENEEDGAVEIIPTVLLIHQNFMLGREQPEAVGDNALAIGEGATASVQRQITLGSFNEAVTGSVDVWFETDPLLLIGNGSDDDNRSNALEMYKSGYTGLNNALRLGAFLWGASSPEDGALQYTAENGFQGYANADWQKFAVIDPLAEDTKLSYYDELTLALKTSAIAYTDLENHLADTANYAAIDIDATDGQVIDTFASDDKGHITGLTLRSLVEADIPDLSSLYADANHNHDADYADISHNHDSNYDDYYKWMIRVNSETAGNVYSGTYLSLIEGSGITMSRSGTSITINATGGDCVPLGGSDGHIFRSDGSGGGSWGSLSADNYGGWDLYIDSVSSAYITKGYNLNFTGSSGIDVAYSSGTITIDGSGVSGGSYTGGTAIDISGSIIDLDIDELSVTSPVLTDYFVFHDNSLGSAKKATLTTLQSLIGGGSTYYAGSLLDLSGTTFNVDLSELTTNSGANTADYIPWITSGGTQYKMLISTLDGLVGSGGSSYYAGSLLDLSGTTFNVDLSELTTNSGADTTDYIPWITSGGTQYKMLISTLESLIGGGGSTYYAGSLLDLSGTTFNVDLSELSANSGADTADYVPWITSGGTQYKMLISTLESLIGGGGSTSFGDGWTIEGSGGWLYFKRNGVSEFQIGTSGIYTDGVVQGFTIQDLG